MFSINSTYLFQPKTTITPHHSQQKKHTQSQSTATNLPASVHKASIAPILNIAIHKLTPILNDATRLVHRLPGRVKGFGILTYCVADQYRLSTIVKTNKDHVSQHLGDYLAKIPEDSVVLGFHGSRERSLLKLRTHKHLYLEVISPETDLKTKITQAQYCTFYTQGTGRLYILCCKKTEEEAIRKEIKFCVENYLDLTSVKHPETGEDRIQLIDITATQGWRSPYTAFRALNQNASTQMHEGNIIL